MPKPSSERAEHETGKPAALVLAPEAPYPMHGGGALRTASLLNYLAERYAVDLVVFEAPTQTHAADHLPPGLVRRVMRIALPAHSRHQVARVVRNGWRLARATTPLVSRFGGFQAQLRQALGDAQYDLGLIEHFWCAPYVRVLAPHCRRTVLDLHNIESELHRTCAGSESWPASAAHQRFRRASERLEREYLPLFTRVLTTSLEDAQAARALAPGVPAIVYPNALPPTPLPAVPEEHVIAFSGNLEYHPNQSAVRYFAARIWPHLHQRWPRLKWRLIGKNEHAVKGLVEGLPNVEVTGPVADAVTELARAAVAVVPLLAGSGTRLKILEAWAAGRAVVSTSIGAAGLAVLDGRDILLRDEPGAFANAVTALLEDSGRRAALGQAARTSFEQTATWETAWRHLGDL